ncbi:MAG: KR domain-containing protein [Bacteroidales bacterium]|nr:KR domain-containing protein [Bacteroidales bacterium]
MVDFSEAMNEIAPKLAGAINILEAVDKKELKLVIAFTSIIGITGMPGNSWYAFSNENLDNYLRNFKITHNIETVTFAYSVWSEIGMGERMGSTEVLAKMGIGAISPSQGIQEFMSWVENKANDQQIVVTSSLGNLDTWKRAQKPLNGTGRFIDQIVYFEPGVELRARTVIKSNTDLYLNDHNYRGSLLFPTVFGLEAMAQAVSVVTGLDYFQNLVIEDISLLKPIVASSDEGIEIEISALVEENTGERKIRTSISTEHTGFTEAHFSAVFFPDRPRVGSKQVLNPENKSLLNIHPQSDLYSWLLFQGPKFRNLSGIYELEPHKTIFSMKNVNGDTSNICFSDNLKKTFLLGSPLLRDVLLQSVQLLISENIVLPIGIKKWELHSIDQQPKGGLAHCTLTEWNKNTGICNVLYTNDENEVVESITGYTVKSMEPVNNGLSLHELQSLGQVIPEKITAAFSRYSSFIDHKINLIAYKHTIPFDQIKQEERRKIEQFVFSDFARHNFSSTTEIQWQPNGKPILNDEMNISISHSAQILLMSVGKEVQGIDIEKVEFRMEEEWQQLLENNYLFASRQFPDPNKSNQKDLNYTRIWSIREVCMKSEGFIPRTISVDYSEEDAVVFKIVNENQESHILTFPVEILPGVFFMVALKIKLKEPKKSFRQQEEYISIRLHKNLRINFILHLRTAGDFSEKPILPIMHCGWEI